MDTITMKVEYITPEIAIEYLKRNFNNRKADQRVIEYYADQMTKGNWRLSPEGVSFDKLGRLIDGQHRLFAVIKADMTIPFMVTKGFGEDVFQTVNTGKNRSANDVFNIENIPNSSSISSGIKLYVNLKNNFNVVTKGNKHLKLSNVDMLNIYNSDPDFYQEVFKKTVSIYLKLRLLRKSEIFSFYVYLIKNKHHSAEKVDQFFEEFNTYSKNDTINLFRNRLIKDKSIKTSEKPIIKRALFVKTWNSFITSKQLKTLKFNPDLDKFPKII